MKSKAVEKTEAIDYAASIWDELSTESKRILKEKVTRLKPSLSDLENLWLTTRDSGWLEISPPENMYFCHLMMENLREESPFRRLAIQQMEDMLPLKNCGGHTKLSILTALIDLYQLEKSKLVWDEISRFLDKFKHAKYVYQETGDRRALSTAISFCSGGRKSPRMRRLFQICKNPEDRAYVKSFFI